MFPIRQLPLFCLCAAQTVIIRPATAQNRDAGIEKYRAHAEEKWEKEIQKLEVRDRAETHPPDSILFIGSSSIRLWDTIGEDIAPYHPIQRGFGGSRFSDLAIFADRLIRPHQFRAVVLFVGNDIAGKDIDKTPREVARLFSYFVGKVREYNAEAPVFCIAVTPTESRWKVWKKQKAANSAIREVCRKMDRVHFIGTESVFLDDQGQPKPHLFSDDKLHLNAKGYELWGPQLRAVSILCLTERLPLRNRRMRVLLNRKCNRGFS